MYYVSCLPRCFLLLLLFSTVGCFHNNKMNKGYKEPVKKDWPDTLTWGKRKDDSYSQLVGGVDYANIGFHYFDLGDGSTLKLVFWTDVTPDMPLGSSSTTHKMSYKSTIKMPHSSSNKIIGKFKQSGTIAHTATTKLRLNYKIWIDSSFSILFWLNQKQYDLNKGSLFLVKHKKDKTIIKQFKRDMNLLDKNIDDFKTIASNDNEIHEFFKKEQLKK